ncbi:MAG: hypothetical protein H6809_07820, partial [Phycisphaeraceae bacterium]|nr:hypothetical protein [Phycisphaeraceae bacterium]
MAGQDSGKMIKIGIAVGALVIAVGLIAWTMFGDGGAGPEMPPPTPPDAQQQQIIDQGQEQMRQQNGGAPVEEAGA